MLAELAEDEDDDGTAADLFSSPVGGGGALGRLLGQLLGVVRQLNGGRPSGCRRANAPDARRNAGRPQHCVLDRHGGAPWRRLPSNAGGRSTPSGTFIAGATARTGARCGRSSRSQRTARLCWCRAGTACVDRSPVSARASTVATGGSQGDEIDIDAVVEARVEAMAGSAPDEAIYVESLRRRRDLAVLLLLDISGSVAEPGATGQTVHEQQRAAAAALTVALHDLGDRVALYAYNSQGRSAVHLVPVKRFDEDLGPLVMRRLHGLVPSAFSRLGAAIRHGAAVLEKRGGTSRRLLVVLSDGLAYDHGYEPAYGAADARRALAEARRRGTGCLCLSIGASTDAETLRRVFGSAAHATIPRTEQLTQVIGPLFRSALRSAEVRRPVSS